MKRSKLHPVLSIEYDNEKMHVVEKDLGKSSKTWFVIPLKQHTCIIFKR